MRAATVSPSQAVSSTRSGRSRDRANRRVRRWRSNKVMLSSRRVRPPQRDTAEKRVASAIVGIVTRLRRPVAKVRRRVADDRPASGITGLPRSVAACRPAAGAGAGTRSCFASRSRARRLSAVDSSSAGAANTSGKIVAGVDSRQRFRRAGRSSSSKQGEAGGTIISR